MIKIKIIILSSPSLLFATGKNKKKPKKGGKVKITERETDESSRRVLNNINFTVAKVYTSFDISIPRLISRSIQPLKILFCFSLQGSLVGVCGSVGSGKSSLLLACLGQLKMISGKISRRGNCAYVSQQSWVESVSLKENILFGEKYESKK